VVTPNASAHNKKTGTAGQMRWSMTLKLSLADFYQLHMGNWRTTGRRVHVVWFHKLMGNLLRIRYARVK
jgi:hypothetical protein